MQAALNRVLESVSVLAPGEMAIVAAVCEWLMGRAPQAKPEATAVDATIPKPRGRPRASAPSRRSKRAKQSPRPVAVVASAMNGDHAADRLSTPQQEQLRFLLATLKPSEIRAQVGVAPELAAQAAQGAALASAVVQRITNSLKAG
jgi:hypothetical protein